MIHFLHFKMQLLYIGPGMGAGYFAVIIGILASFFLSMIAIFWYPLKKIVKYLSSKIKKQ